MTIALALLAYAVALGRSLIDWGVVYPERGPADAAGILPRLVVYSALFGLWTWGLVGLSHGDRRGAWTVLVLTALMGAALGIATSVAFCPTPCPTVAPVADVWNWATTITSVAAIVAIARQVRRG